MCGSNGCKRKDFPAMKSLNEDMKTGNFRPVYLMYGDEAYLKNQYKNRLRKAILQSDDTINFTSYEGRGTDVKQLIDQAETMPFFADHRVIQVENSGFFKNALAYFCAPGKIPAQLCRAHYAVCREIAYKIDAVLAVILKVFHKLTLFIKNLIGG